jgi:phage terminase large subunit-like protein
LPREQRRAVFASLPVAAQRAILDEWWWQAHGGQIEPWRGANVEPWRIWAIVAARGFGKTRAGAEWVWARARADSQARIALVAASLDEVARVMIEGESGLIACARADERPRWTASRGLLLFPSGAQAHAFTAEKPDKLRGPQHHFAWCDELAKWPNAEETWNNLMLGLRLGKRPRTIVTTTPRPIPLLRRLIALDSCAVTHGRTDQNPNNAPTFIEAMREQFAGTRFARQELEGLLIEDYEGALWTRELIEKARGPALSPRGGESWREGVLSQSDPSTAEPVIARSVATKQSRMASESETGLLRSARNDGQGGIPGESTTLARVVIGLDPPASTGGDSCGLVVCGVDEAGIAYVLADLTAQGLSPEAWSRRVAEAAAQYGAGRIVAEKNQGGDMIASVLRAADADLPVRLVAATRSKAARAEPIALRFETGRAKLAGSFPELEDQMCALTWGGYQGTGSPDRVDAMVWAMTELFEREPAVPRVRGL